MLVFTLTTRVFDALQKQRLGIGVGVGVGIDFLQQHRFHGPNFPRHASLLDAGTVNARESEHAPPPYSAEAKTTPGGA